MKIHGHIVFCLKCFYALFVLFSVICFSAFSQDSTQVKDGFVKYYYPNGKVSSEGYLVAGKPDGYWKTFYTSGVLKSEGNRFNFQLDSIWKFYSESGSLLSSFTYKDGKKNGYKRTFAGDSIKFVAEEHYVNDIKQGFSFYYKNDYKFKQVPFIEGRENGLGKEFNKDGIIITLTNYKNGFIGREERINRTDRLGKKNGVHKIFFGNSDIEKIVCTYTDDKLHGYLKEFNLKGDLIRTEKWIDGVLQVNPKELVKLESRKEFYSDGRLKASGSSKQGVLEGIMRFYDTSGTISGSKIFSNGYIIAEGIYDEKGLQQGSWKEFYITGELKSKGTYENGRKVGLWNYYHLNGVQEQIGNYTKGKPDGLWKWYYESGNLLKEETFVLGLPVDEMIEYSDSGKVISKGSFIDGEPEGYWFIEDNDFKEEGIYKAGAKYDEWKYYYLSTGKLQHKGNYVNGEENGKHVYFYENGSIKEEGIFIMGQKNGKWKNYDYQGNINSVIEYKDGIEIKIDGIKLPFSNNVIDINN